MGASENERIFELEEMVADDPGDALAGFMLGSEYLKAERAAEAVLVFRGVLSADPNYSAAGAGLGRALEALGLLDDARVAWKLQESQHEGATTWWRSRRKRLGSGSARGEGR